MSLTDPGRLRPTILAVISAVVMIIVGFVTSNLTYGIGQYVLSTINSSGVNIPTLIPSNQITIVGTAIMIVGIVVLVFAVAVMIRILMEVPETVGK